MNEPICYRPTALLDVFLKGGFHVTSSPPCLWAKTKDLSLAFVRPPEVVHFSIVIDVSRGWLKTSNSRMHIH